MAADERRNHTRVSVNIKANVVEGERDPVRTTIANFSSEGLFLKLPLNVGRRVQVDFILKPDHALCQAQGSVAWKGPLGVGLSLPDGNEEYRAFVDELFAAMDSPNSRRMDEALARILDEPTIDVK